MRAIGGLRRWRHNPLRRRTDLAEAWVALTALLLFLLLAPLTGWFVGAAAQDSLQRSVRDQRASRHPVTATVVRGIPATPFDTDPETGSGRGAHRRVLAQWSAPDGSARSGTVLSDLSSPHAGDHFRIWTDPDGHVASRPLDSATATTHAVLAGFGSTLLAAGVIETVRRVVVWRMVRRRYARWDQAWERVGPDWGRTGAGS